ncbi:MAG: alternative ribosome rescue aminoacyl-tRNA hydrolase ArfB [Phycisphaerae bacterium]
MAFEPTANIAIPEREIELNFVRSGGPGGQHVNKTSTACQLRFDVSSSPSLPRNVKKRLREIAGSRMTQDGVLVIDAREHRSQSQNRDEALQRLATLIRQAATPRKRRRKTKPTAASKRRRLRKKRQRGELKKLRKNPKRENG